MNLITDFADQWMGQFWAVNIQVTVLIALVCVISLCLRRFPARYRYMLWLLVLVRLAIPASLASPWGIGQHLAQLLARGIYWISGQSLGDSSIRLNTAEPVDVRLWQTPDNTMWPLFILWLLGVAVLCVVVVVRCLQLHRKIETFSPIVRHDLIAMISSLSAQMGLRRKIRLFQAGDTMAFPSVYGIIRPAIILPYHMAVNWTAKDLEPVLLHELAHIKRKDCLVNWVQIVLQILYFYNPIIWVANWAIRRERELACDDEVVLYYEGCPMGYVRSMIRAAEEMVFQRRRQIWGFAMAEKFSDLGRRMQRMTCTNYKAHLRYGSVWSVLILAAGFICAGISCSEPEPLSKTNVVVNDLYDGKSGAEKPVLLKQVKPPYTEEARNARAEGVVVLQAIVRKNGSVDSFKVIRSLGYGLDESAIGTIESNWRFQPASYKGKNVDYLVDIEVAFSIY